MPFEARQRALPRFGIPDVMADTSVWMAIEHGTCGSWKSVQRLIAADLPQCASLAELANVVEAMAIARPRWPDEAAAEVQRYLRDLGGRLPVLESALQAATGEAQRRIHPQVIRLADSIRRLEAEKFVLLRWYNNWRRVPPLRHRLASLNDEPRRVAHPHATALASTRNALERVRSNPQAKAAQRVSQREQRLSRLQAVQATGEHVGAMAECQMARILVRGLSDEFHLFHDVNVEADNWIFDGRERRKSAQIDHVVVGPGGVFVIETKRWSKAFTAGGDYYDPYRQVRWAGKLLHFALSKACGQKIKVREVLATTGSLPNKPAESYAKVCAPEGVCGYIRHFKPELGESARTTALSVLSRLC